MKREFIVANFAQEVNQVICKEKFKHDESIAILHFNPLVGKFAFITSGFGSISHASANSASPRILTNTSPTFGETPDQEFFLFSPTLYSPGSESVKQSLMLIIKIVTQLIII